MNFVIQRTIVDKYSMEPTLYMGDNLWVEKLSTRFGNIDRGDIVTISVPGILPEGEDIIIKRVIGLEGEQVEIKDGKVYIDGKALKEDYTKEGITDAKNMGYDKIKVPEGQVYVLGDNRLNSLDSRIIGPVNMDQLTGKAVLRFYPLNKIGLIK